MYRKIVRNVGSFDRFSGKPKRFPAQRSDSSARPSASHTTNAGGTPARALFGAKPAYRSGGFSSARRPSFGGSARPSYGARPSFANRPRFAGGRGGFRGGRGGGRNTGSDIHFSKFINKAVITEEVVKICPGTFVQGFQYR